MLRPAPTGPHVRALLILIYSLLPPPPSPPSRSPAAHILFFVKKRHYSLHNAHMMLTVFKLYGQRKSYDDLRQQVVMATKNEMATFDEFGVGVPICDTHLCAMTSDIMLEMPISRSPDGDGSESSPGPPDGTGVLGSRGLSRGLPPFAEPLSGGGRVGHGGATALPSSSRYLAVRDGSGTSVGGGVGASEPATARERPVVPAGITKEEPLRCPNNVTASPHSDTPAAAAAVAWSARDPGDTPSGCSATAPPGVASPASEGGVDDGDQRQLGASPWGQLDDSLHGLAADGRGGGCQQQQQQQQQDKDNAAALPCTPSASGLGRLVVASPRGAVVPFTPMRGGAGGVARGGPQYCSGSSGACEWSAGGEGGSDNNGENGGGGGGGGTVCSDLIGMLLDD